MKCWVICGSLATALNISASGAQPRESGHSSITPQPLKATVFVRDGSLSLPREIAIVGDRLATLNRPPSTPIQLRRLSDGIVVRNIGAWGDSDDEFVGLFHMDASRDGSLRLCAYDISRRRVGFIDVKDSTSRMGNGIKRWLALRGDAALTGVTWAADSFFSPGLFYTGRIARFAPDGKFAGFIGETPRPIGRDHVGEPSIVTQEAFRATMRANSDATLFVLATRNASQIEIYSRDGKRRALVEGPTPIQPDYTTSYASIEPKFHRDRDARLGYIDLATTRDRIYALFSGKRDAELEGYAAGTEIHVFDWNARLVAIYELAALTNAIAIDERTRILYAVQARPQPAIVTYGLPMAGASATGK